jgi:hypothetical protein
MEGYISGENLCRKVIWSKSTVHIVPQWVALCHNGTLQSIVYDGAYFTYHILHISENNKATQMEHSGGARRAMSSQGKDYLPP